MPQRLRTVYFVQLLTIQIYMILIVLFMYHEQFWSKKIENIKQMYGERQ